ncbi:DUF4062 domain-containing protein [Sinomonas terrae]|uniref:DUF4062 domain-containing protein n=1 Tax=Sinomonas terrae TaxID=2908838 RepID=A0ABS9U2P1_9MICC|nr:DUF4062 domain-containing protein [Sinomonas terrae]MCH6470956.1 DUF4062 domain-containing protein [Sinomonas terrae]
MERREQVFVSSTFLDLKEERQAVIQTLMQADCFPAGMELFPASDDEKWDLIKRVIDDSDYYIVVLGGRYGSTDDEGLSFTEKEFDYAVHSSKPVMGFVHGAPEQIPVGKTDLDDSARKRLLAFKAKVETRMVKYWTTPADLAGAVALSLIQTRKTHPAEGWIRASNALTPEVEKELAELRAQVATLERAADSRENEAARAAATQELAQGNDVYKMPTLVRYWTKEDTAAETFYKNRRKAFFTTVDVTWNEIFNEIGPLMMNEASEDKLDQKLDEVAYLYLQEPIPESPTDLGRLSEVEAGSDVVHDVKVQLFSLGLIKQSDKRHAVQDHNHYWTLTSDGRDSLMRLRAIRRDEQPEEGRAAEPPLDLK